MKFKTASGPVFYVDNKIVGSISISKASESVNKSLPEKNWSHTGTKMHYYIKMQGQTIFNFQFLSLK